MINRCLRIHTFNMQSFPAVFVTVQNIAICNSRGTKAFDNTCCILAALKRSHCVSLGKSSCRCLNTVLLLLNLPSIPCAPKDQESVARYYGFSPLRQDGAYITPWLAPTRFHVTLVEKSSPKAENG